MVTHPDSAASNMKHTNATEQNFFIVWYYCSQVFKRYGGQVPKLPTESRIFLTVRRRAERSISLDRMNRIYGIRG